MWRDILPGGRVSASDINNLADWGEQTVTGNVGVTRSAAGTHISANDDARILIRITGAADAGAYPWEEVYRDAVLGTIEVVGDGREGTTDDSPAYELNDTEDVPEGTVVEATLDESGEFLVFEVPASAMPSALVIEAWDSTPSYTGTHTAQFNETNGFVLTTDITGVVKVDLAEADEFQNGIVTTGTQTFGGDKYFPDGLVAHYVTTPTLGCTTGTAGTFVVNDTLASGKHTIFCVADFGMTVLPWLVFLYNGPSGNQLAEISHDPVVLGTDSDTLSFRLTNGTDSFMQAGLRMNGAFALTKGTWSSASDPYFSCDGNDGVTITEAGVTYTGGIRTGGTLAVPGSAITGTIDGGTW